MKKIIVYISLCFLFAQCNAQTSCSCTLDITGNATVFATKAILVKKGNDIYLKFNCVDIMHVYYNNEQGNEVERDQLHCISKTFTQIKLIPAFEYYNADYKDKSLKELQELFFSGLKTNPSKVYRVDLNEKKEIKMVSDFWLPEK